MCICHSLSLYTVYNLYKINIIITIVVNNYKVNLYCLALGLGHLNYQVGTINASDYFDPRYEYRAADVARHIKICYTTDVIAIY